MLRIRIEQFIRDWWFRAAATLIAGMAVGSVGALASQSERSMAWTAVLIASTALGVAWVLRAAGLARQRYVERDASLVRLRQMGERLAIYDRETGLYAYWYFGLRLNEEVIRSTRYGHELSLLLLEAETGRWARDDEDMLFDFMREAFRDCDLVAHLGNLRFVVLLPNTNVAGATVARERLRMSPELANITVGSATFPDDGQTSEELLVAAGASAEVLAEVANAAPGSRDKRPALPEGELDHNAAAA